MRWRPGARAAAIGPAGAAAAASGVASPAASGVPSPALRAPSPHSPRLLLGPRRRVRAPALAALIASLAALAAVSVLATTGPAPRSSAPGPRAQATTAGAEAAQPGLLSAASVAIGRAERRWWPVRRGAVLVASGGGLRSTFGASGVALRAGGVTLAVALQEVRRGGRVQRVARVPAGARANAAVYRRGPVTESYANGPFGLEQSFVLSRRVPGSGGALALVLRPGGPSRPVPAGDQILFRGRDGAVVARYGGLRAVDADGRRLPASFAVVHGALWLRVEDAHARYPVDIDPFIQEGPKLTGGGEAGAGELGASVALSADGGTALVGAPGDGSGTGAAWVFTRTGAAWAQQGEKLTAESETGAARFGTAVALSADGGTALVGGPGDSAGSGAVWVFTRSDSAWSPQGGKLTGSGETGPGAFGASVALSADGSTALIGAPEDTPAVPHGAGAAWVFTRSGSAWTQLGAKLTGAGETGPGAFATSVALAGDGATAIVGAPHNEWCMGAAWIFGRSGEGWVQQAMVRGTTEGTACDDGPDDGASDELEYGRSVALSGDGSVAVVSRPFLDANRLGETAIYTRNGATWSAPALLHDRRGTKAGASSVALSADGRRLLLGKGEATGRDWALGFVLAGSEWAPEGTAVGPAEQAAPSAFGEAAALSADAGTVLVGGASDDGGTGAAWGFGSSSGPVPGVLTQAATGVAGESATLHGSVDPNGQEVFNCHFEYGTTASYGSNTSCAALPGAGEDPVAVAAAATPLQPNATIHFRLVAAGGGGVGYGEDEVLTTPPGPPAVATGAASPVAQTSATLHATVNPLGQTVSSCVFQYGPSTAYGGSVPCEQSPGSGAVAVEVSATAAGLGEYRAYHFRIVATNATGTSYGADHTFSTLSYAPEFGRCTEVARGAGRFVNSGCTKSGSGPRFEWRPGAPGVHATLKLAGATAALETVKHTRIACKTAAAAGEYAGRKALAGLTLLLTGCELAGQRCASVLAAEGEIATPPLQAVLGVERLGLTTAANKLGLELEPAAGAGAPFAEFSCGITGVVVRGAAIAPVPANKMLAAETLKWSATGGKQHPERFVGGPLVTLEASVGGKPFERTGLILEAAQASTEAVEANTVA